MPCIRCSNGVWICGTNPDCKDQPPSLTLDFYSYRSTQEAMMVEDMIMAEASGDEPTQESPREATTTTEEQTAQWYFGGMVELKKKKRLYMWCGTAKTDAEVAYAVIVGHSKTDPGTGGMTWKDVATPAAKVDVSGEYNVWYRTPAQGGWEVAVVP